MSTYSSSLRIELPSDGTQAGTWGDTTNSNLSYILDKSVAGYQTVSVIAASQALTFTNGPTSTAASNQAVYAMLQFTTTTGAAFAVYAPPASKAYIIWNNSGQSMTLLVSDVIGSITAILGNVALTIANGNKVLVWSDAVSFYDIKANNVTGTVAIANGGTGQTSASAALNALLPSQTSNANKYLQTDGTNSSWDAVSLSTADITGTLAITNGGTGATTASGARTNLGLVIGTDVLSPSGSAASLTSFPTLNQNTTGTASNVTGTVAVVNGGTGATTASGARTNLGLVIGTDVLAPNGSAANLTSFPTLNQNTTGNAATATNPLSGGSFITTSNYNSYVPTLTGIGASGTWGISITGNADTSTRTSYGGGNAFTNIANGAFCFLNNTTGAQNSAMGSSALASNVSGSYNTAFGYIALPSNVLRSHNTAIGAQALYTSQSSDGNTAVGSGALYSYSGTSGASTAVGYQALVACTSGDYNTAVGYDALGTLTGFANCSGLGFGTRTTGSNQVQLGDSSTTTFAYGAVQNRSDLRDKADVRDTTLGLDFVMSLRPVDYKWDMRDFYRPVAPVRPEDSNDEQAQAEYTTAVAAWIEASKLENITHDGSKKRTRYHHGFIAQEVLALNAGFGGVQDHKIAGGDDVLSLGYDEMVAPLVKAIQELKAEFDAYKAAHP